MFRSRASDWMLSSPVLRFTLAYPSQRLTPQQCQQPWNPRRQLHTSGLKRVPKQPCHPAIWNRWRLDRFKSWQHPLMIRLSGVPNAPPRLRPHNDRAFLCCTSLAGHLGLNCVPNSARASRRSAADTPVAIHRQFHEYGRFTQPTIIVLTFPDWLKTQAGI